MLVWVFETAKWTENDDGWRLMTKEPNRKVDEITTYVENGEG
jgi:hypothetical protein